VIQDEVLMSAQTQQHIDSSRPATRQSGRRLPIGAEITQLGASFRVWAPERKTVEVVLETSLDQSQTQAVFALVREPDGYFSGTIPDAGDGTLYRLRLDGNETLYPDPASRFQPEGVHAASQVVDPDAFTWTDQDWQGITPLGQVLYELHIGTFSERGTFEAAADRLATLKELGVTCVELMPVAEFGGNFGWGYDGVDLFAPSHLYGSPDDFRRFVDRAHAIGLAVILDVVYNHLGPNGNYLPAFSSHYLTKKHSNDWGESINFDDAGSEGVRAFYEANARHWISEYHLDGFRFDATHAIRDDSKDHILAQICRAARAAAGTRQIYLVCENEPQETRIVARAEQGGYGMDALWNDDFHHSATVALTGRADAFLSDYRGTPQEFISSAKWGYLFQGQRHRWSKRRRGAPAFDLPPSAFVNYLQNHDQIANYGQGQRIHHLASLAQFKAMTALLLLAPQTPLLFQGQEFASSSTFHYFVDHGGELNKLIRQGRLKELSQFPGSAQADMQQAMRDPSSRQTFERCKLDWSEPDRGFHAQIYLMHKVLLELRRSDPAFAHRDGQRKLDGAVLDNDAFVLRFFTPDKRDRLLMVNLGKDLLLDVVPEPLLAAPPAMQWELMFSTEEQRFGGNGSPPPETRGEPWRFPLENWRIAGHSAVVLKPVPDPTLQR
jgi:maltooligosyltrehalose trehalohydrolase